MCRRAVDHLDGLFDAVEAGGDSIESVDQEGQLSLVDAARKAGVEHFVFVSFRDNPRIQFPLGLAKRAVERALKASGMAYTILQASYFMEVWLTPALGFDAGNRNVRIYGDGSRPISWISYRDVARAAAAAGVSQPAARNMVVEWVVHRRSVRAKWSGCSKPRALGRSRPRAFPKQRSNRR